MRDMPFDVGADLGDQLRHRPGGVGATTGS
jgi:hypothetical protein